MAEQDSSPPPPVLDVQNECFGSYMWKQLRKGNVPPSDTEQTRKFKLSCRYRPHRWDSVSDVSMEFVLIDCSEDRFESFRRLVKRRREADSCYVTYRLIFSQRPTLAFLIGDQTANYQKE